MLTAKNKQVKHGLNILKLLGNFPVVQWLRLHAPNAGGPGWIPGQGTRSHMPQLMTLTATAKTQCNHINK